MAKNDIDNSISANESDAQNFYQDDRIERKSVAWLLTGVSMIATVAICLGVFFGGRAAYREFTSKKTETVATESTNTTFVSTNSLPSTPTPTTTPIVTKPVVITPPPTAIVETVPVAVEQTPTPTPQPVTVIQATPVTKITNTGPGNILATFIAITTLATLSHYAYSRRRLQA